MSSYIRSKRVIKEIVAISVTNNSDAYKYSYIRIKVEEDTCYKRPIHLKSMYTYSYIGLNVEEDTCYKRPIHLKSL